MLSDKEWDQLFALMDKAVNVEELTAKEKGEAIVAAATKRDQDTTLEEFVGMLELAMDDD